MKTLAEIQDIISDEITKINLDIEPTGLYAPIKYTISQGGKRIRPALTLLACNLFSEDITPSISAALGLEIFHNFTLLHDDIMDKADIRRGQLTVHKKWDENTAILSGDVMQVLAYQYIARTPENILAKTLQAFSKMAVEICEGQQYDMDFEKKENISTEDYLHMIRLKTSVLLGTALQIGAWIGGGSEEDADLLYEFGINIGLAFQLKDDWLDVYGNEKIFGKKIGGDIRCNKKTFLLIEALKRAKNEDMEKLWYWLTENGRDNEKVSAVTSIYNKLGIKVECENKMEHYYNLSMESLNNVSVNEDKKEELIKLAKKLILRNE